MTTNQWLDLPIPAPVSEETLETIRTGVDTLQTLVDTIGTTALEAIEIIEAFVAAQVNPVALILYQLAIGFRDFIQGLIDLGVAATWVLPRYGINQSLSDALDLLGASVVDRLDENRPLTGNSVEEVYFLVFTFRFPNLEELGNFLPTLQALFSAPTWPNLENFLNKFGQDTPDEPLDDGTWEYPDWSKLKFVELVKPVRPILEEALEVANLLVELTGLPYIVFEDIRRALLMKLAQLAKILETIDTILLFIEALLANDIFEVLYIQGELNPAGLAGEISSAAFEIPSPFDDSAVALALAATGPTVNEAWETLLGL